MRKAYNDEEDRAIKKRLARKKEREEPYAITKACTYKIWLDATQHVAQMSTKETMNECVIHADRQECT
jgi:hypothetical protein